MRIGEIFSLRWCRVDWRKEILNVFAPKSEKIRAIPMNVGTLKVLQACRLGMKNEFVFKNLQTGNPFVDLKAGFAVACRKGGLE